MNNGVYSQANIALLNQYLKESAALSGVSLEQENKEAEKNASLGNAPRGTEQDLMNSLNGLAAMGAGAMALNGCSVYRLPNFYDKKVVEAQTQQAPQAPVTNPITKTKPQAATPLRNTVDLGNERILFQDTNNSYELPKYLYHVTSADKLGLIEDLGGLRKSVADQLDGYLIAKDNFLNQYNDELMTGAFKQAIKAPMNSGLKSCHNICVTKLPTAELLKQGKLSVRRQADVSEITEQLNALQEDAEVKVKFEDLHDEQNREILKSNLKNSGLDEETVGYYLDDIEERLHGGYSLNTAQEESFEQNEPIRYIFNRDLNFNTVQGAQRLSFELSDILTRQGDKLVVDRAKVSEIF